jgi:hypothetical protein
MAAPDSYRLRVLKALCAQLGEITVANGYDYDLTVARGRTTFGEESLAVLPLVSVLESPQPAAGLDAGDEGTRRKESWLLLLQGWVADDKAHPTDPAYQLMAAVEKCLGEVTSVDRHGNPENPDAYHLGGLIDGLVFGPGLAHPPAKDLSSKAFFYLPVRVAIAYDVRKPYSAPNET